MRQDRPESEWKTERRDHYRIVTDEIWQAVRARMGNDRLNAGTSGRGGCPKSLFGGLLHCSKCSGALVAVNKRYYGCVTRKERGSSTCEGVHISRQQTDERLLSVLRDELGADESQADIETTVRRYFAGECSGAQESAKHIREKIGEIANLTAVLAKIGISDAIMETLSKKENEREALKRTLAQTQVDADQFADIARRVREKTSELREALSGEATVEARQIIAKLMGPIGIERRKERTSRPTTTFPKGFLLQPLETCL